MPNQSGTKMVNQLSSPRVASWNIGLIIHRSLTVSDALALAVLIESSCAGCLEIRKQTQASNGLYTLVASNPLGITEKSINVTFNHGKVQLHFLHESTIVY